MNTNMQRLGDTLSNRMKRTAGAAVTVTAELGTINKNMSLATDSLSTPIPKGEYMVNLLLGDTYTTSVTTHTHSGGGHSGHESGDGSHTHDDGRHSHSFSLRGLKVGDRVLVVWCGHEPVVVAIVVSS